MSNCVFKSNNNCIYTINFDALVIYLCSISIRSKKRENMVLFFLLFLKKKLNINYIYVDAIVIGNNMINNFDCFLQFVCLLRNKFFY